MMNGQSTRGSKWTRRKFVASVIQAGGAMSLMGMSACSSSKKPDIPVQFVGANANFGHLLKTQEKQVPAYTLEVPILIIGGGISALTTAYELWNRGLKDFLIIDNGRSPGGNAVSGKNEYSAYPWGAHYLTLPNPDNTDLIKFLDANHFIEGYNDKGIPHYREEHICHAPQERLFIKNKWQDGLVPRYGVEGKHAQQIKRFTRYIEELKQARNTKGEFLHNIPLQNSRYTSSDLELDQITFKEWLKNNNYDSEVLNWFLNYGTKDDYGTVIDDISALVGLHYFGARRGEGAHGINNTILTWPEGNNHLVQVLSGAFREKIKSNILAFDVDTSGERVKVQCIEEGKGGTFEVLAEKCVFATPQYINRRLLKNDPEFQSRDFPEIQYSPWLVANITVKELDHADQYVGLCWDNVIYGSESLGYVYAQHQNLDPVRGPKVITWYFPITHASGLEARKFLRSTDEQYWLNKIIADLEIPHPGIRRHIVDIQLWEWGHAMVKPLPGLVTQLLNSTIQSPLRNRCFFCHSDLSGISLFEEAFSHGIRVSREILNSYHV